MSAYDPEDDTGIFSSQRPPTLSRMPPKNCNIIYQRSNCERIAAEIDRSAADIMAFAHKFEAAAMWYRLAMRRPRRMPRSKLVEKLNSIAKNARHLLKKLETDNREEASFAGGAGRLLTSLAIDDPVEASDGPGNPDVLAALTFGGDFDEETVIEATRRIGQLAENEDPMQAANNVERRTIIVEAKEAACILERRALNALRELEESSDTYENDGDLVKVNVVPKGYGGKVSENDWIAATMSLYEEITGRVAGTSVAKPGEPNEGKATGPLVRFLKAASKPLGIKLTEDALRGRVRTIQKTPRHQN